MEGEWKLSLHTETVFVFQPGPILSVKLAYADMLGVTQSEEWGVAGSSISAVCFIESAVPGLQCSLKSVFDKW